MYNSLGFGKGRWREERIVTFADQVEEVQCAEGPPAGLNMFLNETGPYKKRARIEIEDILNATDEEPARRAVKKARKRGQKALRHLREIVGRQGCGLIDYKKLAEEINVSVWLLDLFQMSPDLSKAFRTLSTRVNKKNLKKAKVSRENDQDSGHDQDGDVMFSGDVDLGVLKGANPKVLKHIAPLLTMEQKPLRVPGVVRAKRNGKVVDVTLPLSVSRADSGSDMVVVTIGFLKALGIPAKALVGRGFSGLTMNVADGNTAELTHYSVFNLGVYGVWRKVEAFVRPHNKANEEEIHLLLGMPWLHMVNARIFIRESAIEIGDPRAGEKIVRIHGPRFVESTHHKLVLHPKDSHSKPAVPVYVESDSEDSEDSDSDSELSSDDGGVGPRHSEN